MKNNKDTQNTSKNNAQNVDFSKLSKTLKAKQYSKIHKKSEYEQTQALTALSKSYEDADNLLKDRPYAHRIQPLQTFYNFLVSGYPAISVLLSVCAGYFIGDFLAGGSAVVGFAYWSTFIPVVLGIVTLAIVVELLKSQVSVSVFQYKKNLGFLLMVFTSISIFISGSGGYIASYRLADNSTNIENEFKMKSDSVTAIYMEQIEAINLGIESSKQTLQRYKKGWRANTARADLEKLTKQKSELLALIDSKNSSSDLEKSKILASDNTLNIKKSLAIGVIVLLLEIMYIVAQSQKYSIARKIRTEKVTHNMADDVEEIELEKPEKLTLETVAMNLILNQLSGNLLLANNGQNGLMLPQNIAQSVPDTAQKEQQKAGFKFGNQDLSKSLEQDLDKSLIKGLEQEEIKKILSSKGVFKLSLNTFHAPLFNDIIAGERHYPTLTKKHKKNINTVYSHFAYALNPYPILPK